jgi:ABC-2 type transport system permease protein
MFLAYSAYTAICVAIGVSVSAMCQSRQTAFLSLAVTWAVLMIFVPRIATDVATGIHPQPDARDVAARLSAASDTYYRDMDRRNQIEQDVLAEYGAESVDELPINYGAYLLQVSEELSEPEFEALYGELDSRYADQERTAKWFSLVTPRIAIGSLSRGLAGADRVHQRAFAQDAEMHRREMIKLLNEDYMYNAGVSGASYTANENLWAEFSDFDGQPPAIGSVIGSYSGDIAWLVLWLLASVGGSAFLVTRAVRGEVAAT